jgi:glycosyltransferase involved in cell wall biosynthesis
VRPDRIDQVVPSFSGRDAIGVHMLHLRDVIRSSGFASDIWCEGTFPDVRAECRLLKELPARRRPGAWWLYHLSSGSPVADTIAARPEPKMLDYHNITPAEFFDPWVPWGVEQAHHGRAQLDAMLGVSFYAFADSAFNAAELRARGFDRTVVVPPLFDTSRLTTEIDRDTATTLRDDRRGGGADWLFVGRLTPSKAQHDLIKALACYRRLYDPRARLHIVGSSMGEDYPRALRGLASRLGLGAAVRFSGPVSDAALAAYYASADIFVCASEHEGFCVPVVEAMACGVPVVALGATAVAETAADSALLVEDKSPLAFATAVHRVLSDGGLRAVLVQAGARRAEHFSLERGQTQWAGALEMAVRAYETGASAPGGAIDAKGVA